MAEEKYKTVRRNWLQEGYNIATGRSSMKPKKEHIKALVAACNELSNRTDRLLEAMRHVYADVAASRAKEGKPMPPLPNELLGRIRR